MAIDPHAVETWFIGQLILGGVWLLKEILRTYFDRGRQNTEDIGSLKIENAKIKQDLNAAWERIRMNEQSDAKDVSQTDDK